MPWHVARSDECPASKPWAVIKDSDGTVEGCHANKDAARRQMAALYAQEDSTKMQRKSFDIIETKTHGETGEFTALVSVFGNVDKVGDRVVDGAYTKTLKKWRDSGDPFPVVLAHRWNDVMAHIGYADPNNVQQVPQGLLVKGKLDIEDNPIARQTYKLMKRRTLKEFSIGYTVPVGGEKRAKDGANDLLEIDLVEFGPCLKGVNDATELRAVKSALEEQTVEQELQTLKDRLAAAQAEVEEWRSKAADATDKEPERVRSVDTLRRQADVVALEYATDGLPRKSPERVTRPKPEPELTLQELRQRMRDEMLTHLSGEPT